MILVSVMPAKVLVMVSVLPANVLEMVRLVFQFTFTFTFAFFIFYSKFGGVASPLILKTETSLFELVLRHDPPTK